MRQTKRQKLNDTLAMTSEAGQCFCKTAARKLVVRKDGPNKGKIFYTCPSSKCKYFKWGDEYDALINLSKYKPDGEYIIKMELQRRYTNRFIPTYAILKNDNERASFFCIEKDRSQLVQKLVNQVYSNKEIHYSESLEVLNYHVDFRYKGNKVYCVFAKYNWSMDTEKRLQSLNERGIIKYDEVVSQTKYTNHQIDYSKLWIQLHGVTEHEKGWLFGGISDFIIFEIAPGQYKHVKRQHLLKFILENCEGLPYLYPTIHSFNGIKLNVKNNQSLTPYDAHLKVYKHNGHNRHDAYCYIELKDLDHLIK